MDYEKANYRINKFCEFSNQETEDKFLSREGRSNITLVRVMVLLAGIFFFAFFISDYFYFREAQQVLLRSAVIRTVVLGICAALFFAMGRMKGYKVVAGYVTAVELIMFFALMLICYVQQSQALLQQAMGVALLILLSFLIPNRWRNSMMNGAFMWIGFMLLAQSHTNADAAAMVEAGAYVGLFLAGMAVLIYLKEKTKRTQYANEKKLEIMTFTDSMTGAYNRLKFESVLELQMDKSDESGERFSVLLFDLDDFKRVNDAYGHAVGDRVLQETARVIRSNIREGDVFARWGGEEFVVLFENTKLEKAAALAERLRQAMEHHRFEGIGDVTISCGVTEYLQGDTDSSVISRADDMMYFAKLDGKNRVVASCLKKLPGNLRHSKWEFTGDGKRIAQNEVTFSH